MTTKENRIYTPFDDETMELLETYQGSLMFHPYTCCDHQTMRVSRAGLVCPKCGVVQNWISTSSVNLVKNFREHYE